MTLITPTAVVAASADTEADIATLLDEPPRPRWYRRPVAWAGLAVLLLAGLGWHYWQAGQAERTAPSYVTQPVGRGSLTLNVVANGTLQPTRSMSIGSELSGTVLKVHVDVNDRVHKGQVLVELDTARLRDQIVRSRASLATANAKVAQTTATLKETRASLARLEEVARLSGGKVPSQAELDGARATVERAVADDASARASVTDARAAVSSDETNLSKASIRAPSDGVVLTRNVDPGNAVAASLQAVTLFTVAEDLAKLRLQVNVDEADVGAVKTGQDATFTVSAYAGRKYPARITRVAYGSTITDNVVTYVTYLDVDNTDLSLRPGMTATATITATQRTDALRVPNSALRFAPSSGNGPPAAAARGGIASGLLPRMPGAPTRRSAAAGGSTAGARQVWVLPEGGAGPAVAVAVTPGISDGRMTEIIGGDLRAGMQVIVDQKMRASK
jgi:HlyD family secretion protein